MFCKVGCATNEHQRLFQNELKTLLWAFKNLVIVSIRNSKFQQLASLTQILPWKSNKKYKAAGCLDKCTRAEKIDHHTDWMQLFSSNNKVEAFRNIF